MTDPAPPLVVDAMLGSLARWLRRLGYDAAYLSDTPDIELVRLALAESRVIVTKDVELSRRNGVRTLLIEAQELEDQIAEVGRELGTPPEPITPRCGVCNAPLQSLPYEQAEGRVPPYIWRTHDTFSECSGCRRIYWRGSHWDAIQSRLGNDHSSF